MKLPFDPRVIPPPALVTAELDRRRCKGLAEFARRAWHVLEPSAPLKWGWALDAICDHLEAVTRGEILRLLINCPPGTMKSLLVGVLWPAWEWGPMGLPGHRFMGTAHKQDLAIRDNMKCRRLIKSDWYQTRWPVALVGDQDARTKFENEATGFREAMAFTSMTGSRGDRVLLDDPHSVDDAYSPKELANAVRTFREALPSRVNNDESAIVIVMQRLHEKDVSAVALELGYDHLCIPMRFEPEHAKPWPNGGRDPRTEPEELMFPERFGPAYVANLEKSLGTYGAAGQLQQRPSPLGGGLFKRSWFAPIHALPAGHRRRVRAWDLAATEAEAGKDPDWTAGVRMSHGSEGLFVIEGVRRTRGTPAAVEAELKLTAAADGPQVAITLPQDPGQAGKSQATGLVKMLAGYAVSAKPITGSKILRARAVMAQAEAGNVRLLVTGDPAKDAWIEPFLAEIETFPAGSHDDQVDAMADAFNELALGTGQGLFNAL